MPNGNCPEQECVDRPKSVWGRAMSSETSDHSAGWSALAAEAREVADGMTDPEAKLVMLSIAQVYETLAKRARERELKKDPPIKG